MQGGGPLRKQHSEHSCPKSANEDAVMKHFAAGLGKEGMAGKELSSTTERTFQSKSACREGV